MKLRNMGFSWATLKEVWGWSLGLRLDGDNLGYSSPARQASCMVRRRSMLKLVRQGGTMCKRIDKQNVGTCPSNLSSDKDIYKF